MKLVLQIFRKDALHLWKEILVTWALLAWLTQLDCWRSGYLPDSNEGWLNLLLPLAWIYLAGLCVLQDPVPGERPFWLALPVRRGAVLSAKALFAAAFIHLPYFISCAIILAARGFNPALELPTLLMKQLAVLMVLTMPAMALASLSRNAMQYLLFAITLAGAAIVVTGKGGSPFQRAPYLLIDSTRLEMVLLVMFLFLAGALLTQYRARRTRMSRGVGLTGVLMAGALYLWLPVLASAVVEAALRPVRNGDRIEVRVEASEVQEKFGFPPPVNAIQLSIPLEVVGAPSQRAFSQLDFEVDSADGRRVEANLNAWGAMPMSPSMRAVINGNFLDFLIQRSIFDSVSRGPATLKGHLLVTEMSDRVRRAIPNSGRSNVPDLGLCGDFLTEGDLYSEGGMRVVCESPNEIPHSRVILTDTETGRHWDGMLGSGGWHLISYPSLTWLSPVHRSETFFQITTVSDPGKPADFWKVSRETLRHYRVDAEIQTVAGTKVVKYELPGIDLNRYVVKASR